MAASDIGLKYRQLRKFRPKRSIRAHAAVATYLGLGGTVDPWGRRSPGAFILHPSRIDHALRTAEEPLLALFAWHGVLESDLAMPLDDL
jgi:hypothetical protein